MKQANNKKTNVKKKKRYIPKADIEMMREDQYEKKMFGEWYE